MKEIKLTQQLVAQVSDEDYEILSRHKWCAAKISKYCYAVRSISCGPGKKKRIYMHRAVLNAPDGLLVDHINHDTLDNRRENLRLATASENSTNQRPRTRKRGTTKGVQFSKNKTNPWKVMAWDGKKMVGLGYYPTEERAAEIYKNYAKQKHGKFYYDGTGL